VDLDARPTSAVVKVPKPVIGVGKVAVAGLLIWWLIASGTLDLSALRIFLDRPMLLVANVAIFTFTNVLAAFRWRLLLRLAGVHVSAYRALTLQWVGAFFNVVVPGNIGGDVLRSIYVARDLPPGQRATVFAVTFLDRIIALAGLVVVAAALTFAPNAAAWGDPRFHQVATAIAVLVVLTLVVPIVGLVLVRRSSSWIDRWTESRSWVARTARQLVAAARLVATRPDGLFVALVLAVVIHIVGIIWFTELATTITARDISVMSMASVYPLGMLTTLLPISYAGFGVGHLAFEQLFTMVGLHGGATVINVYLVGLTAPCIVGVIPYLMLRREPPPSITEVPNV
jgi:glycosyltransferase 2 family protein